MGLLSALPVLAVTLDTGDWCGNQIIYVDTQFLSQFSQSFYRSGLTASFYVYNLDTVHFGAARQFSLGEVSVFSPDQKGRFAIQELIDN